jgi:4-amino-4-deoxy-L-arabinose transferase-like glycosyltransferase
MHRSASVRDGVLLIAAAALLLAAYGWTLRQGPALADEFIYLAGARHFAETGRLDARYYDADAIVARGHPHHDVHAPGYVLLLGAFDLVAGATNRAAVALNVIAYMAAALLVHALARALEVEPGRARTAALLALLVPAALPYVYWVMAETVLTALVLAALVLAARGEDRPRCAAAAGVVLGLALLVRESALFALPALGALVRGRARRAALLAFALFVLLVYAPLSRQRAPGGANFWAPSSGQAFGFEAVQAARAGRLPAALALVGRRVATNAAELAGPDTTWTERGILATFLALPALALARWREHSPRARRYLIGLAAGLAAVVALLFGVYVVGEWSGLRYALFLIPGFLPLAVPRGRGGKALAAAVVALDVLLLLGIRRVLDDYKASRQKRQAGIADYVDRFVPEVPARIVLANGWLYGWRHYPTEVVSSLPDPDALRRLERAVPFDVLVVPAGSALHHDTEARRRYERVNATDPDPPLVIFRRLR